MANARGSRLLKILALSAWPAFAAAGPGPSDGEALFYRACATCHLGRGGLIGEAPLPVLLQEPLRYGDSEEALFAVIRKGTGAPLMPAFAGVLTDEEIRSIVGYVREQRAAAKR